MSYYARRVESPARFAGPPVIRKEPEAMAPRNDELLSDFTSETTTQEIVAPTASVATTSNESDIAESAERVPSVEIRVEPAIPLPPRVHPTYTRRRARRRFGALRTNLRKWRSSAEEAVGLLPSILRFGGARRLATTPTLTSFVVGAAAGVLIMWFAGLGAPSAVAPSTARMVSQQTALPTPALDSSPEAVQAATESTRAGSTPSSSVANPPIRQIGTSGRNADPAPDSAGTRVVPVRQAATSSRVTPAVPARSGSASGGARSSYRGSLAFRSAPQGARVFVNGAFVGSTPLVLHNLPVGSRAVRIEADGYQRWSASTQVVANQQTRVSATLGRSVP